MFNVLSIAQQYYINHQGGTVELVPVANPNKKKGFMSRLMEAAEEQTKINKRKRNRFLVSSVFERQLIK